jgi:hypothetical protein
LPVFDFVEWKSEIGVAKARMERSLSSQIVPGMIGPECVVGSGTKPTLITRDAQHEYVFEPRRGDQDGRFFSGEGRAAGMLSQQFHSATGATV